MKLGEAVYKSQQKGNKDDKGTGGPKATKPGEKDNVVDADFEDVKEDKEKKAPKIINKETSCGSKRDCYDVKRYSERCIQRRYKKSL